MQFSIPLPPEISRENQSDRSVECFPQDYLHVLVTAIPTSFINFYLSLLS